jgi:hypothetical protein
LRSEDNSFCLKAVAVVPLPNVEQNGGGEPSTEKDFETQHSGVFAPPGLPAPIFNCGIRVQPP